MALNVTRAEYKGDYKIYMIFSNGDSRFIDLRESIFNDTRNVCKPLRNLVYFQKFKIKPTSITWPNEATFTTDYLYTIGGTATRKLKPVVEESLAK